MFSVFTDSQRGVPPIKYFLNSVSTENPKLFLKKIFWSQNK